MNTTTPPEKFKSLAEANGWTARDEDTDVDGTSHAVTCAADRTVDGITLLAMVGFCISEDTGRWSTMETENGGKTYVVDVDTGQEWHWKAAKEWKHLLTQTHEEIIARLPGFTTNRTAREISRHLRAI